MLQCSRHIGLQETPKIITTLRLRNNREHVCAAFGLTVSEAYTEITCLRTKGIPETTAIFSVEAADQVYNQTKEFV